MLLISWLAAGVKHFWWQSVVLGLLLQGVHKHRRSENPPATTWNFPAKINFISLQKVEVKLFSESPDSPFIL